jgi:hypothetical protein
MAEHVIHVNHALFPFFFVGCWNKGSESQKRVTDAMRDLVPVAKPQAIILGGDNIYPEKSRTPSRSKRYSQTRLEEGAASMLALGLPTYVSLGNHNVADPAILRAELEDIPWTLPHNYYCIRSTAQPGTQIVIIDTNLYQDNEPHTVVARARQEEWLNHILADYAGNESLIVQHQPIFGYKKKKDATTLALPNAANLINILSVHRPVAVLSADIHNYQDINLMHPPTRQLVVGTGGADLDELPPVTPLARDTYCGNGFLIVNSARDTTFIMA